MLNLEELEKQLGKLNDTCIQFFEKNLNDSHNKYIVTFDSLTLNLLNLYKIALLNEGKIVEDKIPIILTKNAWLTKAKEYGEQLKKSKYIPTLIMKADIDYGDELREMIKTMDIRARENFSKEEQIQLITIYNKFETKIKTICMSLRQAKSFCVQNGDNKFIDLSSESVIEDRDHMPIYYDSLAILMTLGRDGVISNIPNSVTFSIDKQDIEVLDKNFISIKNPECHDYVWVKEIVNNLGVVGLFTFYGTETKNGKIMITPFTFLDEMDLDNEKLISAFSQVNNGFKGKVENELQDENKKDLLVDLLYFLFNQNLMLLLKEKIKLYNIDYNFCKAQYEPISFRNLLEERECPWMSLENMKAIISKMVNNNLYVGKLNTENQGNINQEVLEKVEDKMYLHICKTELQKAKIYEKINIWSPHPSPLKERLLENKENILETVYILLRYMNLGALETDVTKTYLTDKYTISGLWTTSSVLLKPMRYWEDLCIAALCDKDTAFGSIPDDVCTRNANETLAEALDLPDEKEKVEKLQKLITEVHSMHIFLWWLENYDVMNFFGKYDPWKDLLISDRYMKKNIWKNYNGYARKKELR